MELGITIS